ncbi:hypothetical protein TrVFT333_006845 [Trichoderma virens FT-333]|nr:hypothetical protein TrVFT333_006845 [Trichoderma virens FT-333]
MYHRAAIQQLGLSRSAAGRALWPSLASSRWHLRTLANGNRLKAKSQLLSCSPRSLPISRNFSSTALRPNSFDDDSKTGTYSEADHEHAVISTFDLFSIGIGPSSSHTVGPMRAGNIFVSDLHAAGLLEKVDRIRVALYGSLALTGEGHMTPSALLLGLESANVETVDTDYVPKRFEQIKAEKKLFLGQQLGNGVGKEIAFDYERDFKWEWTRKLLSIATACVLCVGGGFVVNGALSINKPDSSASSSAQDAGLGLSEVHQQQADGNTGHPLDLAENMYYKEIRREDAAGDRRTGPEIKQLEDTAEQSSALLTSGFEGGHAPPVTSSAEDAPESGTLCDKHNLTIAQLVYENEKSHGYTDEQIRDKVFRIWEVMDNSILEGVQAPPDSTLPGSLKLHRRAPALYRRLTRGLYPSHATQGTETVQAQLPSEDKALPSSSDASGSSTLTTTSAPPSSGRKSVATRRSMPLRTHGSFNHPVLPSPRRRTTFPAMDYLTVYAMAVNETNAAGGRIVTAPTNGAAGIIPAVLKYTIEFVSDDPERDILSFLLTAAAIGMLYKRGATISAAEGGCMAEVGVACSMAAGAFAACMGASPQKIEQAAEIGIEHNLGLTCDPIGGLVQAPCIERNALGAIKAISSANLALSGETGTQKVSLDDAIRAMRVTAQGMRNEFKETSLSGLATSVPLHIPVSVPDC